MTSKHQLEREEKARKKAASDLRLNIGLSAVFFCLGLITSFLALPQLTDFKWSEDKLSVPIESQSNPNADVFGFPIQLLNRGRFPIEDIYAAWTPNGCETVHVGNEPVDESNTPIGPLDPGGPPLTIQFPGMMGNLKVAMRPEMPDNCSMRIDVKAKWNVWGWHRDITRSIKYVAEYRGQNELRWVQQDPRY